MPTSLLVATPSWSIFSVRGPDAVSWLNGIVTSDLEETKRGRAVFGLLLTKHGKVQGELQFYKREEGLLVAVSGGDAEDIVATLSRYLVMEDAEIEVEPAMRALVAFGEVPVEAGLHPLNWHPTEKVGLFVGTIEEVLERESQLLKSGAAAVDVADASLRFRLSLPLYGRDYSGDDNPHDSSLERRAVSWSKGCYLGQEVVCMQDMRGKAKRRLVRLTPVAKPLSVGEKVLAESGEEVGVVTTAAAQGSIARVKAPHFEATTLRVGEETVRVTALLGEAGPR